MWHRFSRSNLKKNGGGFWRLLYALPLFVLLLSSFLSIASVVWPHKAEAAGLTDRGIRNAQLRWVNFGTIDAKIDGQELTFRMSADLKKGFGIFRVQNYSCSGQITFDKWSGRSAPSQAKLDLDYIPADNAVNGGCQNVGDPGYAIPKTVADPQNFKIYFSITSDLHTINPWNGDSDWQFTQSQKYSTLFTRNSESGQVCQDIISVNPVSKTYRLYELTTSGGFVAPDGIHAQGCFLADKNGFIPVDDGTSYPLGGAGVASLTPDNLKKAATTAPPPGGGNGGVGNTADSNKQLGCDGQFTSPITWILCPIINDVLVPAINWIDGLITDQLDINTAPIFGNASGNNCKNPSNASSAYYCAWQSFRNLALGLLAIAGLVIIISQALGMEILDAYTIRKTLPKLLTAVIGISLSWPLMHFAIDLSNGLGLGVRHLIYAPFHGLNENLNFSSGASALAITGALPAWILIGGLGGLLALAATAGLAVLVAITILILRQIAIILLMLLSPIAFVAYILPNTNRVWRLWWDSFSKALLMFPLIAGFIAAGRVFSAIAVQSGDTIHQVIGFVAYFAPYFMIPMTLRMAGGLVGGLGNFVNSRAQGGFNFLRNARAEAGKKKQAEYAQKFTTGGFKPIVPARFKTLNSLNRGLVNATNNVGRRYHAGLIRGGLGFGARGETALEESLMEGAEAAQKEPAMHENATINGFNRLMVLMAKHKGNETAAMAELRGWYGGDRNEYNRAFQGHELEEKLTDAQARLRNVGGYNPARAVASYLAMGRDGTAIRDVRDSGEIAAWVSEGSAATAYNLLSQVASDSKRNARSELSPSQDHKAALVGATVAAHKGQTVADYDLIIDRATMSGAGGEGAYSVMMNAPSRVVRGNVEHATDIIRRYNNDPTSVDFKDAAQAAAVIRDLQSNSRYAKTDNKVALMEAMSVGDREKQLKDFLGSSVQTITDDQGNEVHIRPTASVTNDYGDRVGVKLRTGQDYVDQIDGGPGPAIPDQLLHDMDVQAHQQPEPPPEQQQ